MGYSLLRALVLRLASLALLRPVGRFFVEVLLFPRPLTEDVPLPSLATGGGLKVIACGFGRTGTTSLKVALNRLGFNCYHGRHLCLADWGYGDSGRQANLWLQAATQENWDSWEQILQGYSALADFPAAFFYKRLMAAYPDAKIILNVRDADRWHRSCMETLFWLHNKLFFQVFRSKTLIEFCEAAMWQGKFQGKFEDKEFAINVYKSHVEEVTRIVPKERLLVYETRDGWAPLCDFLQVDIPDTPFPHGNDSLTFRNNCKKQERAYAVFSAVYVGVMSCGLAVLVKWGCHFSRRS